MFIVSTQVLENYGAHSEDGKFSSGNHYWKFKGGSEYLVEDLDREQDAMAFVAALCMENGIGYKEFPTEIETVPEWAKKLPDDAGEVQSCRDYYLSRVIRVSPMAPKDLSKRGITEEEAQDMGFSQFVY